MNRWLEQMIGNLDYVKILAGIQNMYYAKSNGIL